MFRSTITTSHFCCFNIVTITFEPSTNVSDPTLGDVTITLPRAQDHEGKIVKVKKSVAHANKVIIDAHDTQTIDGELTIALESDFAGVSLICDGTAWFVM